MSAVKFFGDLMCGRLLQVELLRRWRSADPGQREALVPIVMLSVNALAAAMQSTG